jgi:precorrin-6B methylase 2
LIAKAFHFCFRTLFPKSATLLRNVKILASEQGQWNSIDKAQSVDGNGRPLPWYTYPAIEFLESLDFSRCDVFEFGAGNSSLYWAARARTVTSVEDDPRWHGRVVARAARNQTTWLRPDEAAYVAAVAQSESGYDVIVIDGNHRIGCTRAAIDCLRPGGMIVLDNSDREIERSCSLILRDAQFIQIDFSGFGPMNGYCWSTSIFFKRDFSLNANFRDPRPVGGLRN